MIAHALTIVKNELDSHLTALHEGGPHAALGNPAEVIAAAGNGAGRNLILLSLVNLQEERTLKNGPTYVRDDAALRIRYQNPPTLLNLAVLVTATHTEYVDALKGLSRAITFFQYKNVFTHENVRPQSLQTGAPIDDTDRLSEFRLVLNLGSPSLEEVNDMWGMLGGKQFPFALYSMRMLELKFDAIQHEAGVITEVVSRFSVKTPVG